MRPNLDHSQWEAVCCGAGPSEIIAGPGSGKTTVLTEHILYLIEHTGLDPSQILVLTFSRAAAAEMKERFSARSGGRFKGVRFGTFHSVFFYILRESSGRNYALLGASAKEKLLRHLLENYYTDPSERPTEEELEKILRRNAAAGGDQEKIRAIRRDYSRFLKENGYLDFDDMILKCKNLLESDERVRAHWSGQFRAILVDEFQDVNIEQYELLRLLTDGSMLFVVGDDDQSIYGFRGSSPSVMQKFMDDFQGSKRLHLAYNYRCSANICKASALMIRENRQRIAKTARAARAAGDRVVLKGFPGEKEEYRYLADSLKNMPAHELSRTAVITRTNLHVHKIGKILSAEGIACSGKVSPSQAVLDTVLRDMEHYYKLACASRSGILPRQSIYRVMNRPDRFLLRSIADEEMISVQRLMENAIRSRGSAAELEELLNDLRVLGTLDAEGFVRYLLYSMGYGKWSQEHLGDRYAVKSILNEILRVSRGFENCGELIASARKGGLFSTGYNSKGIWIMTMHACKGLEFDRVYLPSLNEGIIPGRRCREPQEIEEERRLLYVAMTRAKEHLEMLYVTGTRENPRPPSRFLSVYGIKSFVYS